MLNVIKSPDGVSTAPVVVTIESADLPMHLEKYINIAPTYWKSQTITLSYAPPMGSVYIERHDTLYPDKVTQLKGYLFCATGSSDNLIIDNGALSHCLYYLRRMAAYRNMSRVAICYSCANQSLAVIKEASEIFAKSRVAVDIIPSETPAFPDGTTLTVEDVCRESGKEDSEDSEACRIVYKLSIDGVVLTAKPDVIGLPCDGVAEGDMYSYDAKQGCWRVDSEAKADAQNRIDELWNSLNISSS